MRPGVRIAATNVDTLTAQLAAADAELRSLVDQYNSLAASLPKAEQDAAYEAIDAELNPLGKRVTTDDETTTDSA